MERFNGDFSMENLLESLFDRDGERKEGLSVDPLEGLGLVTVVNSERGLAITAAETERCREYSAF